MPTYLEIIPSALDGWVWKNILGAHFWPLEDPVQIRGLVRPSFAPRSGLGQNGYFLIFLARLFFWSWQIARKRQLMESGHRTLDCWVWINILGTHFSPLEDPVQIRGLVRPSFAPRSGLGRNGYF